MKKDKTGVSETSGDTKVRRGLWSRLFRKQCEETAATSQQSGSASLPDSPEPSSLADEITVSAGITSEQLTSQASSGAMSDSDEEYQRQVASLAKAIWIAEGCPEGMAEEHWFRAERELRKE